MSESENKPKLGRKPLGLKKSVDAGEVKQTFSHGRTNNVVVEVKRRKVLGKRPASEAEPVQAEPDVKKPEAEPKAAAPAKKAPVEAKETRQEMQARLLREAEEARQNSLEQSNKREDDQRRKAAEDKRKSSGKKSKADDEPEVQPSAEAEVAAESETEAKPEEKASETPASAEPEPESKSASTAPRMFTPVARPETKRPDEAAKRGDLQSPKKTDRTRGDRNDRRQSGKLTVARALNEDEGARARSLAALKRAREKEKRAQYAVKKQPREKQARDVIVPEVITVAELAKRMDEKGSVLVKALFNLDMVVTVNQSIDADTAELLVEEFGHNFQRVSESDIDLDSTADVDPEESLKPRAPIVTIMGHVDHGKTSLLDALRGTDVVKGEAGGITQHIGAYQITTKDKHTLTFLDTPGHEAFTQMRMRGANVTDIVVLVVAADDGIMPQTIEAIKHTKAAGVPMIVAINKCDKNEANPQRVRERLLEHEIVVEAMSGDVQDVEVSAKSGDGIDELIEKIMLQAELLELTANPDRGAEATVIEAKLDKGKGPLATVLVSRGTLKRGDIFVVGTQSGRVRAIHDDKGKQVKEAGPSMPVEVLGLGGVPNAGDQLTVVENEQRAREVSEYRQEQATEKRTAVEPTSLENMFSALKDKESVIEFPVVIKADVQGSVEAIATALNNLSNDDIKVRILTSGAGAITESDVTLASASGAPILGFNVRPNPKARVLIEKHKTRMMYYDVIYQLTDEIAKEMAGELGPEKIEHVVGRADVKEVFKSGKKDKAAGLLVTEGNIRKGLFARLTRDDVIVSATTIASLRRFKDDVDEVRSGLECGVVLEDTNDIKPGDSLEVFEIEERERTL